MARVTANAFIGGGLSDAVWVAPKATTFPVGLAVPVSPWKELGWLGEDGIEGNPNVDRKEFRGHQGGTIIRRKVTGSGRTWTFTCLEHNLTVMGLVHPGTTWVKTAGPPAYVTGTVPEGIATVELAWVIESFDTTNNDQQRYMFTGEATLNGAFKFGVEDMTGYEFELAAYGSPVYVTNKASIVADVT